jgi:hypothetical protein
MPSTPNSFAILNPNLYLHHPHQTGASPGGGGTSVLRPHAVAIGRLYGGRKEKEGKPVL